MCFGVLCIGLKLHFEISWINSALIFGPLAFIFGSWLVRDEMKVNL